MPDTILLAQAAYLSGAAIGLVLILRSPLPAALFWGTAMTLQLALATAELADRIGWTAFVGLEGDLRYFAFTLGAVGFALGAVFSLVVPSGTNRMTLFTGIGLAVLIATAADRLPLGQLPLPLVLLGVLMVAVLVGLRHRPVPGRWLLLATLAAGLAELARYRYLGFVPLPPDSLAKTFHALALVCFGLTAHRAR